MSLNNTQYDAIMRSYDSDRIAAEREASDMLKHITKTVPGFKELSDSIASLGSEATRHMLKGNSADLISVNSRIDELSKKKLALLREYGYDDDALLVKYRCPDCKDTGFTKDGNKCHCFLQKEINLLYSQSNINLILQNDNFDNLSYEYYEGEDLERFRKAVTICREFTDNFTKNYDNIIFYGTVGTGKSFLAGCIAKALLDKGHGVIYFSSSELFRILSDIMFGHGELSELKALRSRLYECELLIIDDLGTEITNSAVAAQLFSLLNERHLLKRPTVISTNMSMEELQDRYADRIFSRIIERYSFIKLTGPDIRRLKKIK